MCEGFCWLLVLPSPKSQSQEFGSPKEVSLKVTSCPRSGTDGLNVKAAVGVSHWLRQSTLLLPAATAIPPFHATSLILLRPPLLSWVQLMPSGLVKIRLLTTAMNRVPAQVIALAAWALPICSVQIIPSGLVKAEFLVVFTATKRLPFQAIPSRLTIDPTEP